MVVLISLYLAYFIGGKFSYCYPLSSLRIYSLSEMGIRNVVHWHLQIVGVNIHVCKLTCVFRKY